LKIQKGGEEKRKKSRSQTIKETNCSPWERGVQRKKGEYCKKKEGMFVKWVKSKEGEIRIYTTSTGLKEGLPKKKICGWKFRVRGK